MATQDNETNNTEAAAGHNDIGAPTLDLSLWQIHQQYQQMVKQIQFQTKKQIIFKKRYMLLKKSLLQVQLQLQKCVRLQWLLKCCCDQADNQCKHREDEDFTLVDDELAEEFTFHEVQAKNLPVIPRSWVKQPWRWCAAGYGGCCRHCPIVDLSPQELQQQAQQRMEWIKQQQQQQKQEKQMQDHEQQQEQKRQQEQDQQMEQKLERQKDRELVLQQEQEWEQRRLHGGRSPSQLSVSNNNPGDEYDQELQ